MVHLLLQSLSKLSEDCESKRYLLKRKLPVTARLSIDETLNKVQEYFDAEALDADVSQIEGQPENLLSVAQKQKHEQIISKSKDRVEQLIQLLKEELNKGVDSAISQSDMAVSYLDLILVEGSKRIVELTVSSIEQMLSVAEALLQEPSSEEEQEPVDELENNKNFPKIVYILKLVNGFHADISQVSTNFINSIRSAGSLAKSAGEAIEKKATANANTLVLDTTSALSHIQDCQKYLLSVCQSLVVTDKV